MKTASNLSILGQAILVVAISWILLSYSLVFSCLATSKNASECRGNSASDFVSWTLSPFIK